MSAVEEIQQAIATLERLRAESTPGPWSKWTDISVVGINPEVVWPGDVKVADADLIVALHRTIGALGDLLEGERVVALAFGDRYSAVSMTDILALARAINGGAS